MSVSQKSQKSLESLIDKTQKKLVIEHIHHYEEHKTPQNLPKKEDIEKDKILKRKTAAFQKYSRKLAFQIFQPDEYEKMVSGVKPQESPLLAALHGFHKSSYLTPLPAAAYERQIDVDSKYVREGQYVYGAQ
jgi:hypothetical protein